jgi:hypothetical protein
MRTIGIFVAVVWLLFMSPVQAQSTTQRLTWEQPGISTLTEVNALVYRLQIDTAPPAPVAQTCALVNTLFTCSTPLPALSAGPHTLTLFVDNGFGSASATLSGNAPASPVKLTITITVNVTSP